MNGFMNNLIENLRLIRTMSFSDVLDVLIVAVAIYALIAFVRRTNAIRVAQGLFLLFVALWLSSSSVLNLTLTSFLLRQVFEIGILAVIVLFQPEIRRALERVGSYRLFSLMGKEMGGQVIDKAIMQTVYACKDMSRTRTGALIVFERRNSLNEPLASGTPLDSAVTAELLKTIFFDKTPLHDGAVIVKDGRIAAAGCMLPLSDNANLSRDLGMRHRAGIGMSERSDAVVVIVSEETGSISVAVDGLLKRRLGADTFEMLLRRELLPEEEENGGGVLRGFLDRVKGNKDAEQNGEKGD